MESGFHNCKNDSMKVCESEKAKLKMLLKNVAKISLTTDLWHSGNQKMKYMVLIGHWIDGTWRLNRRVLNFVHLPPPCTGVMIADSISKCLTEWKIENKVYTVSVDNALSNNIAIRILRENFEVMGNLICEGKLFHVRCCAHILNLIVFTEIVQQLKLSFQKLILHYKTRWNLTYEMLAMAIKFKKVFPRLKEKDSSYHYYPQDEDWEKVCDILKVFSGTTNLISGSDYPTSNIFLKEVCLVKMMLDSKSKDGDEFIRNMVRKMKEKFDKYSGECNVLMSVAAVLDPRLKMRVIQ
ncbi:zinc finger BED domain-containing protein RICESLEEPER 2-like [Pistacia vera]|uniref:zinc finger BED domain-containing protein RICESLEEPER 2-like n=1 Tax=Pistacia vera TaxID=55513 RepID=UPI00126366E2|nr:zinc finger BED domain-containing protein RICESLEEPER 2-like [Pistacia vera]